MRLFHVRSFAAILCVPIVMVIVFSSGCKPAGSAPGSGSQGGGGNAEAPFSEEQTAQLLAWRNRAMAELENGRFADAEATLSKLAESIAADPLVTRNRLINRLLWLMETDVHQKPDEARQRSEGLRTAAADALKVEGNAADVHRLASRAFRQFDQPNEAMAELQRAAELNPRDPSLWYEMFDVERSRHAGDESNAGRFIDQMLQLAPENLFAWQERLRQQATSRDAALAASIETFRPLIEPFAAAIKQNHRVDVLATLDQSAKAATAGEWNKAAAVLRVCNVLKPEPSVQSDLRRLHQHPLEYMVHNFSEATQRRLKRPPASAAPAPIDVAWSVPSEGDRFPSLDDARAVCEGDFDLDLRSDVAVLQSNRLVVLNRALEGGWSVSMTHDGLASFAGMLSADLDDDVILPPPGQPADASTPKTRWHDADADLILYGDAGLLAIENRLDAGTKSRTWVAQPGSSDWANVGAVKAAALADLDSEGDLDVIAATSTGIRLWRNVGAFRFEEMTRHSQLPPSSHPVSLLEVVDWDGDVDLDVLIAGPEGGGWLENVRHGRFRWRNDDALAKSLTGVDRLWPVDWNRDGRWDLLAARGDQVEVLIDGAAVFEMKEQPPAGSAVAAADFDNDGRLDVATRTTNESTMLRAVAMDRWQVQSLAGLSAIDGARAATADLDRDGDLDVIATVQGRPAWFRNDGGNANGWIDVELKAKQVKDADPHASGRVNHFGLGSLIEVKAGDLYERRIVAGRSTHLGLGARRQADVVRVLWTNGVPRNVIDARGNQSLFEEQQLLGSCPYLYTWDGERFTFYTDLLWNSPIGLKFAEDVVAPWREWELLKIDGHALAAIDGEYRLRITEELWEAAYFDQVRLRTIDHPAGTEVYTNEKVGPAAIAAPAVHAVARRHPIVKAIDQEGRDLTEALRSKDGVYEHSWRVKRRQGMADPHILELHLPAESDVASSSSAGDAAARVMLYLTGWVRPADTSINVSVSQAADLPKMVPPSIWVPADDGHWREAVPFMGFPGGKTKTIAIDLTNVVVPGDRRIQIRSTMELYWDEAFVTIGEQAVEYVDQECRLASAELRRRGVSAVLKDAGLGPDRYDYNCVDQSPRWPHMSGSFTRLGDVRELLLERDDRMAVFGEGDELALAFEAPVKPLPAGWVRDFVIENVGWDKDCNLNTVYGDSVEPLPFQAMTEYGFIDGEPREVDPAYADYLKRYQTRQQPPRAFRSAVRSPAGDRP